MGIGHVPETGGWLRRGRESGVGMRGEGGSEAAEG